MLNDGEFIQLLDYFERPWSGYRKVRKGVKKRVRRHMVRLGCRTMEAYLAQIETSPHERQLCEELLLVTISRFFRDAQLWQHLQAQLLPRLIATFSTSIRLWSAGCARGEEAYSLAILWASLATASRLELLATDMQVQCLNRAKAGVYTRGSLKELPDDLRDTYFRAQRGGRQFCIQPERLPHITWRVHNLFDPSPPGPFHMILLRNNLLTYHRGARLATALEHITAVLAPGGYLIVGARERLPPPASGLRQDPQWPWIYKKADREVGTPFTVGS